MERTGAKKQQKWDQTVVVRKYKSSDRPEVLQVFSEGMLEMVTDTAFRGLRYHPESLLQYLAVTGSCLWVAVLDGKVVGLVAAIQKSQNVVVLQRMSVDRRYRCCGVGMALGQKVLEFALTQGYSRVILGTTAYQPAAHQLYKRLGFRWMGVTNRDRTSAAGPGPSRLQRVFYRVQHHHYMIQVGQKNSNDLYDKKQKS